MTSTCTVLHVHPERNVWVERVLERRSGCDKIPRPTSKMERKLPWGHSRLLDQLSIPIRHCLRRSQRHHGLHAILPRQYRMILEMIQMILKIDLWWSWSGQGEPDKWVLTGVDLEHYLKKVIKLKEIRILNFLLKSRQITGWQRSCVITIEQRGNWISQSNQESKSVNVQDWWIFKSIDFRQKTQESQSVTSHHFGFTEIWTHNWTESDKCLDTILVPWGHSGWIQERWSALVQFGMDGSLDAKGTRIPYL